MEPAVLGKSVGVAVQPVPPRRPRWSFTGERIQGLIRSVQADSIIGMQPLHGACRNLWGGLADPVRSPSTMECTEHLEGLAGVVLQRARCDGVR
jgi:hypothetical protein